MSEAEAVMLEIEVQVEGHETATAPEAEASGSSEASGQDASAASEGNAEQVDEPATLESIPGSAHGAEDGTETSDASGVVAEDSETDGETD